MTEVKRSAFTSAHCYKLSVRRPDKALVIGDRRRTCFGFEAQVFSWSPHSGPIPRHNVTAVLKLTHCTKSQEVAGEISPFQLECTSERLCSAVAQMVHSSMLFLSADRDEFSSSVRLMFKFFCFLHESVWQLYSVSCIQWCGCAETQSTCNLLPIACTYVKNIPIQNLKCQLTHEKLEASIFM